MIVQTEKKFYILELYTNEVIVLKEKVQTINIFYEAMTTYISWVELVNEILVVVIGEIKENKLHECLKFSI